MISYNITYSSFGMNGVKYFTEKKEFVDENHFNNYIKKCGKDESRRKITGYTRVYSEAKEFTMNDMKAAYTYAKSSNWDTFEVWFENHFKTKIK